MGIHALSWLLEADAARRRIPMPPTPELVCDCGATDDLRKGFPIPRLDPGYDPDYSKWRMLKTADARRKLEGWANSGLLPGIDLAAYAERLWCADCADGEWCNLQ